MPDDARRPPPAHPLEPHATGTAGRLNWLRAGVLGANDGIVSVAGIVIGVAGATSHAGRSSPPASPAWSAGAVSMALGEYVSVSSQRDSEHALIAQERRELARRPRGRARRIRGALRGQRTVRDDRTHGRRGADRPRRARRAPGRRTAHRPRRPRQPGAGRGASAVSFTVGALLRCSRSCCPRPACACPVTFAAVLVALALTGAVSARLGGSDVRRAVLRVVIGGAARPGLHLRRRAPVRHRHRLSRRRESSRGREGSRDPGDAALDSRA